MRLFRRRVIKELDEQTEQNLADMSDMAVTLSNIQDEVTLANTPAVKHFRPWWLLVTMIAALVVGGGSFIGVQRITEVDKNTKAIFEGCAIRNEALTVINEKFAQLTVLFDASLAGRDPDQPPPSDEILRLYAEFRKPIPLKSCEESP